MSSPSVYQESRRFDPRPEDGDPVPYLRHGQFVSLIRWTRERGEWRYSTVVAQYDSRDSTYWYLHVRGVAAHLPRAEWAIFC